MRFLFRLFVIAGGLIASYASAQPVSGVAVQIMNGVSMPTIRDPIRAEGSDSDRGFSEYPHGAAYNYETRALADLERGLIRGKALSSAWDNAGFTAVLFDQFTITGAPNTTASVTFTFAVDGSGDLDDVGDSNRDFSLEAQLFSYVLGTGRPGETSRYAHKWGLYTLNIGGNEIFETIPEGDVDVRRNEKSFFDVVLSTTLSVPIRADGQSNPVPVEWTMKGLARASQFQGGGMAILNVMNTGRAGLIVSDGYTFSSASGVFATAPVPEPETYALLLAGLGLIGLAVRRRKHA